MNEIKLRPCPFCGGEALVEEWIEDAPIENGFIGYGVCCTKCCTEGLMTERGYYWGSREEAVNTWNRRAKDGLD